MNERRPDFLGFFSGTSVSRSNALRLSGATFSDFLLIREFDGSLSVAPPDLLLKGRFADSLSARGLFTACTNSLRELVAVSF